MDNNTAIIEITTSTFNEGETPGIIKAFFPDIILRNNLFFCNSYSCPKIDSVNWNPFYTKFKLLSWLPTQMLLNFNLTLIAPPV